MVFVTKQAVFVLLAVATAPVSGQLVPDGGGSGATFGATGKLYYNRGRYPYPLTMSSSCCT